MQIHVEYFTVPLNQPPRSDRINLTSLLRGHYLIEGLDTDIPTTEEEEEEEEGLV